MNEPDRHDAAHTVRRSQRSRRHQKESSAKPTVLIGVVVALLLIVLVVGVDLLLSAGRIHPRVSVAGVGVGGLSPVGAQVALDKALVARVRKPVTVTYKDQSWTVKAEDIGLSFDGPAQVERAMAVGRDGGVFVAIGDRIRAVFAGVDVAAVPVADEEKLNGVLDAIAEGTDIPAKNATVEIKGTTPEVHEGKNGKALQREVMRRALLAAFVTEGTRELRAPVAVEKMRVNAAEAERAAALATKMLDSPVTVTYEGKSWAFAPEEFAPWIDVAPTLQPEGQAQSASATLTVTISPDLARKKVLARVGSKVGRAAKNASFKTANGQVTIVPSKEGIGPDIEGLALSMTNELQDQGSDHSIELRTKRVEPEITTDKARAMGIKDRIGTYTTTYESSNRPRVNNIHLLGDALDGTLIKPGGTFSFNGAAGQRTAAKGYQEANAIVQGRLVPQLGGGVCQVGTTVFNAVFKSGLPVVERHNHSFYISHYPDGRDATVSWGGPDLKFKNSTDNWVLVSVSYTSSSITVSLYGTDPGYEVEAEKGKWTNVRKAGTEEIKDPKLAKGSKVVEESGVAGRSIVVKRIVSKDGKVVRTDTFVSKYRPKSQIVRVGTKEVKSKTETETP